VIARLQVPVAVQMITKRTRSSLPTWVSTMRPVFHFKGGRFSFLSRTKSLIFKLFCCSFHLTRFCKLATYSVNHLRCISSYRSSLEIFVSDKSFSGMLVNDSPTKKCPGVNGCKSDGSEDKGDKGLEFKQASIRTNTVDSSSNVNRWLPITLLRWYLQDFTPASHKPPRCGE